MGTEGNESKFVVLDSMMYYFAAKWLAIWCIFGDIRLS